MVGRPPPPPRPPGRGPPPPLDLVAAFGPEHGFRGSQQAGGSEGDTVDARTGVPVYDAYGADPRRLTELFRRRRTARLAPGQRLRVDSRLPENGSTTPPSRIRIAARSSFSW
jgi:hypothetical protein